MKEKLEINKGITLVALVITIIILLILAGISISSLTGSGLFKRTEDAKESYEEAENKENSILGEYENYIDNLGKDDNIINFTLDGAKYSCEKGTKWNEFADNNLKGTTYGVDIYSEKEFLIWADSNTWTGENAVPIKATYILKDGNKVSFYDEICNGEYFKEGKFELEVYINQIYLKMW